MTAETKDVTSQQCFKYMSLYKHIPWKPVLYSCPILGFSLLQTVLVQVWYPMTVATHSRYQKEIIAKFLHETADDLKSLPFKLNDLGFRGSTSVEVSVL